jgi:hypothetical protein
LFLAYFKSKPINGDFAAIEMRKNGWYGTWQSMISAGYKTRRSKWRI